MKHTGQQKNPTFCSCSMLPSGSVKRFPTKRMRSTMTACQRAAPRPSLRAAPLCYTRRWFQTAPSPSLPTMMHPSQLVTHRQCLAPQQSASIQKNMCVFHSLTSRQRSLQTSSLMESYWLCRWLLKRRAVTTVGPAVPCPPPRWTSTTMKTSPPNSVTHRKHTMNVPN